ncbi:MAG: SpoIIIAH-like family protein [bacterium]|nr:SpoIIIAH-like family protein [bacterium]
MKKGLIVHKRQIVLGVMILALGAAVWLNMKYSATDGTINATDEQSSVLGDAQYVSGSNIQESSKIQDSGDYFKNARKERTESRNEATELLQDTIDDAKSDGKKVESAASQLAVISKRIDDEAAIESLIKAKGFKDAVAVISDDSVSVIVKSEGLLSSETIQIQDIVISQTGVGLDKIKILTVE